MSILFILVPLGLALTGVAVWAFFWAVGAGQFDDLETPASSVLDGQDEEPPPASSQQQHRGVGSIAPPLAGAEASPDMRGTRRSTD